MERLLRRITPAIGLAFVLTACGFSTESNSAEGGEPVADVDDTGAAAGACLEGTEDCVDADLDGGDLEEPMDGDLDVDAARRDAESLLGATEEDLEVWGDVRIARKGDEEFMMTMDLQPGRKTVELDEDADGVHRVTTVTLELPDGSTEVFES